MEIIINNQQAVLKEGTSFDFIAENRLFTGSDSYTLTITFPLRGCAQNIAIFGHIHRADVAKNKVVFDCEIRDRDFYRSGTIAITEISDVEVKTQFLEGRSEQNFDETFDDIYLNELDLGYPTSRVAVAGHCMDDMRPYPDNFWIPLPWVNNTSGNIQNEMVWSADRNEFIWPHEANAQTGAQALSFQPYLLYILYRICKQVGYKWDFMALENSAFVNLLICNTLPAAWGAYNFALALPHWTLTEFFEELEKFLFGDFTINHKQKTISFKFSDAIATEANEVLLDKVVDSYTTQVTQEDKSEYLGSVNVKYEDNGSLLWAYHSCDWYIRKYGRDAKVYDKMADLLEAAKSLKISGVYTRQTRPNASSTQYVRGYKYGSDGHKLFYVKENRTYFVMYCYKSEFVMEGTSGFSDKTKTKWYRYYNRLLPVNAYGERFADKNAEDLELKIVPAWIEGTGDSHGNMLFMNCGEMGSSENWTLTEDGSGSSSGSRSDRVFGSSTSANTIDYDAGDLAQGAASRTIAKGENKNTDAYFDQIYMGFWNGVQYFKPYMPHPVVDFVEVSDEFQAFITPFSLRLNEGMWEEKREVLYKIDGKKKYQFSFLSNTLPNPRALYYIRGGKYVCEKITATFKESGMSQLLKGTFYRVLDEDE